MSAPASRGFTKPQYLYRRNTVWYFRWSFSRSIVNLLNRRELRLGLGTAYRRVAMHRGAALAARMVAFQTRAEREYAMAPMLTPQHIESLLQTYVRESLDEFERGLSWHPMVEAPGQLAAERAWLDNARSDLETRLRTRDTRREVADAQTFLAHAGITVPENSDAEMYLRRGLLRADHFILGTMAERLDGNYAADPFLGFAVPSPATPAVTQKRLSEVIREFTDDHLRSNRWGDKTQMDNAAIFRDFVEIVGDMPVASISKDTLRPYRQTIIALPPNRTKDRRYRDLSIAEILKLPDVKPLSVCRANKHFVLVAQLFKWAIDKGYVSTNPATGMSLPKEKRDDEARAPFNLGELRKIFLSDEFKSRRCGTQARSPYMFWLPVLGLVTGARIEELAALRLDDIKQIDGVWVVDINVKHRRVKNKSSIRQVALHPVIEQLGFPDYVALRRKQGHGLLFPELGLRQGRRGVTASNWFARYLDRLGITGKDKVFHSFRHTLIDHCKQADLAESAIKDIVGHENSSVTYGLYGKRLRPQAQLDYLRRVDFGIELSSLGGIWQMLLSQRK